MAVASPSTALAVTHPCCGNLGGGGFMLIHLANGQNHFINFRERAPLADASAMYVDAQGKPIASKSLEGGSPSERLEQFWAWRPRERI